MEITDQKPWRGSVKRRQPGGSPRLGRGALNRAISVLLSFGFAVSAIVAPSPRATAEGSNYTFGGDYMTASAAPSADAAAATGLDDATLDGAVAQATAEWLAIDPAADFTTTTVVVADLAGLALGLTTTTDVGTAIEIDRDAAGWGWSESGMDLLTVVRHELGHALGHDHPADGAEGLMEALLAPGETHNVPVLELSAIDTIGLTATSD